MRQKKNPAVKNSGVCGLGFIL
jgi:hypothetical protein